MWTFAVGTVVNRHTNHTDGVGGGEAPARFLVAVLNGNQTGDVSIVSAYGVNATGTPKGVTRKDPQAG